MTASGTSGYGDELAAYTDLGALGAVVTKSLSPFRWEGNPAPRVVPADSGMVNAVGLQNPGVAAWREEQLPRLAAAGAAVVASVWGRTVADYAAAAAGLADAELAAVEVNISCPNLESADEMFAHSPAAAAAAVGAVVEGCGPTPVWAKLSPNAADVVPVAAAVLDAGADAVTLVNTLMALAIDAETGKPALGNVFGGLSGPAIRPVALRAVYDVRAALGPVPIVGVGGIASAEHAVEFLSAGAVAVQVGTAGFADPRAAQRIAAGLVRWCERRGVGAVSELVGRAHGE
ncbi:MAG TPA: dihydroorotate dehydrogenase [Acidimicrobiaceae bacterium]|nr:dihydroorotate dehydrogenase [Acidimicrobiaceae bacterium]